MIRVQVQNEPEDVVHFLEAAREAAENRYQDPKYSYIREALWKVFASSVEWLRYSLEPGIVLLEALQDERAVLDRHNRCQAKAHPQQEKVQLIPEELVNFPLRFVCLKENHVKLPTGFLQPIFQVEENLQTPTTTFSERTTNTSIGRLADAPLPTHDFPDGNFTLTEIAAFLPQSIKSWDIADRIVWNGAASKDLAIMFNKYRGLSPKIDINSVYLMFRGQMRKRTEEEHGYKNWKKWIVSAQSDVQKPDNFDPDSISVTGFRRPVIFQNRPNIPANPIPFRDLAKGVAEWPTGYEALDLTRCVAWCADHPEAEFYYPSDYQTVLHQCVGGPLTPNYRHSDAHALARLRSGTGRTAPRRRTTRNHVNDGDADSDDESGNAKLGKRKRGTPSRDERGKRRKSTAANTTRTTRSAAARPLSKKFTQLEIDSNVTTDDDAYQGPKRMKKNKDGPRRSGRNKTKTASYADEGVDTVQEDDVKGEAEGEEDQDYDETEDHGDDYDEGVNDMHVDE